MKKVNLGNSGLYASEIALGCMRINSVPFEDAERGVLKAIDLGIDLFDHADIYAKGASEEIFGKIIAQNKIKREDLIIQTKCGIRKGFFDFSKKHIIEAVNGSLKRLNMDYVDILALHRPDALMEPEEVAAAFDELYNSGKVKYFGVSNQNPGQIQLLQKYTKHKLIVNQLQFGIMHTGMIDFGINVNMKTDGANNRDGGVLEFCRLNDISIQTWSPFQYGYFEGVFLGNEKFPELNAVLDRIAKEKGVSNSAIAVAWILRHPAKMQVITGSFNPKHISSAAQASGISITKEEWYEIYRAAGNKLP